MFDFKKLVTKYLRDVAEKIDAGTSEISEDEAMDIMRVIAHEPLSKEQACSYMNMSRSNFDKKVLLKEIPKGRKRRGHTELDWYKDELDMCKKKQ